MYQMNELVAHAATAIALGDRDRQEDAVVADFPQGAEMGLVVLSDGMGGHDDGHIASRIIVAEIFGELLFKSAQIDRMRDTPCDVLKSAVSAANYSLRAHTEAGSGQAGMGGTVVSAIVLDNALRWISVGDSLLYLFRDGALQRLNQDHSMAAHIDYLAQQGVLDDVTARNHPQRSCLTSALTGNAIDLIDCPEQALDLRPDDIVLIASDGLNVLPMTELQEILHRCCSEHPQALAARVLQAVEDLNAPEQDNISLAAIKMASRGAAVSSERNRAHMHVPQTASRPRSIAARIGGAWQSCITTLSRNLVP